MNAEVCRDDPQLVERERGVPVQPAADALLAHPSRRFDLHAAVELLRPRNKAALERRHLDGYDTAKIKKALTGEELEWAMAAGTGNNIVKIT